MRKIGKDAILCRCDLDFRVDLLKWESFDFHLWTMTGSRWEFTLILSVFLDMDIL